MADLQGAGILITRPARQAAAFASKIAALGGKPIIFPAIVIVPPRDRAALDHARNNIGEYDFAFFVSANAVEYGAFDVQRWPPSVVAFAPGPGTAQALADAGIANVRVPTDRFDTEGILALSELQDVHGKRALIFRGDGGRELLADTLRNRGAHVDCVETYRRETPPLDTSGLLRAFDDARIDAVTITSREGVDNLWQIADERLRALWRSKPTLASHSRIAAHARHLGLNVVETAGGDAGLIGGLLEWFAAHPIVR